MSEDGQINTTLSDHIFTIEVDRKQKMNSFTPAMFDDLSSAFAELEANDDAWVGVLIFKGKHTTAGLDLPKFAGSMRDGSRDRDAAADERIDAFSISRRCSKPVVMAVQGVCFTIGIEMMLGLDIVVAADDTRFAQLEPKRGLAVFGGAHVRYVQRAGWGNAMYHLLRADEFDAARARELGMVQEVVPVGQQIDRAHELAQEIAACAPLRCGRSNALPACIWNPVNAPLSMRSPTCAPEPPIATTSQRVSHRSPSAGLRCSKADDRLALACARRFNRRIPRPDLLRPQRVVGPLRFCAGTRTGCGVRLRQRLCRLLRRA